MPKNILPVDDESGGMELAGKIILVRHGETDWNREKRIQGAASNPPLNKEGRRQAESLALRLSQHKIIIRLK
jgi:broad specificity phosphatase PhoE